MATKKNRKMAKKRADDISYIPMFMAIIAVLGFLLAFGIVLQRLDPALFSSSIPSPTQQIGLTVIASNSPIPSGIVAYVPITLGNPSNTTMPQNVAITINISKYSSYLSQNQSNLEFYYELPSWPESNSSLPKSAVAGHYFEILNYTIVESNSSTIIAMVQLPSGVAPNSNMTIYMGFK